MTRAERTIDVLMKAFVTGELNHGNACECAVGNLCNGKNEWINFNNDGFSRYFRIRGHQQIAETGYGPSEIFQIEQAFEGRDDSLLIKCYAEETLDRNNDPDGFKGLCNVFDTLEIIEPEFFGEKVDIMKLVELETV